MARSFSHDDAVAVASKIMALVPTTLDVHGLVYNDGLTLALIIGNPLGDKHLYEFGWTGRTDDADGAPALAPTDDLLLKIAAAWRSGSPSHVISTAPVARDVHSAMEFEHWIKTAKSGHQAIYFRGHLAQFREDAHKRLLQLQTLADKARGWAARPAREVVQVQLIQQQLDLLEAVTLASSRELVMLTQRKTTGEGAIYCATRLGGLHA